MNIKITYKWLLEYLDTDADPYEIQKYLSLSGPSVERVEKKDDDYIFDIEVTSNRVDMASVLGIAQEAVAILPMFGKKAHLKKNPLEIYTFTPDLKEKKEKKLIIENDKTLCSRFTAIVLSNITIGESSDFIKQRLEACDIRSINNVVDISNYLMISLGQPVHMFDYDKIGDGKMKVRESVKGEKLTTLDGREITLPGGDIVMEDGTGTLFDLCGIMGGENSQISNETKNVIFFVQIYNKQKIRKTSMTTGQRSVAATYFEKDLDEERVEPTVMLGLYFLKKFANAEISSELYDIDHTPYTPHHIEISISDVEKIAGIKMEKETISLILTRLGFSIEEKNNVYDITVPSYRRDDIKIKADIIEELTRVYGYHNLPNNIQPTTHVKQPIELHNMFIIQQKIKYLLKHLGLHEVMNYSMISKELIVGLDYSPEDFLMISNTISEEIKYMRTTLFPSLIKNLKDNQGKKDILRFFEIAKVYLPHNNSLPHEEYKIGLGFNTDFFDMKGIIENLLKELHINNVSYTISDHYIFASNIQSRIMIGDKEIGVFGQLKSLYKEKNGLSGNVILAEIDLMDLVNNFKLLPLYVSPNQFAVIKLDLTISKNDDKPYGLIVEKAKKISSLLTDIELHDTYQDKLTLRFYFSSNTKNITEDEAKEELEKIKISLNI